MVLKPHQPGDPRTPRKNRTRTDDAEEIPTFYALLRKEDVLQYQDDGRRRKQQNHRIKASHLGIAGQNRREST